MITLEVGQSTMERAAFHEAAHAVMTWELGGEVIAMEIEYEDDLREWRGVTIPRGLTDESTVQMLYAGGLGEALYVANVYDPAEWILDAGPSKASILRPVPHPDYDLTFTGSNNAGTRTLRFQEDILFSNDIRIVEQKVQQGLVAQNRLDALLTNAIDLLNSKQGWDALVETANQFLRRPPRLMTWRFGPDGEENKQQYRIDTLATKAKAILKG